MTHDRDCAKAPQQTQGLARCKTIVVVVALASLLLSGCGSLAMTALGVGASAGVQHTANAVSSRTFTASTPQVRSASLAALNRMNITVRGIESRDGAEIILAASADRRIEIELEALNKSVTQMRATAKLNVFVHDAATAREIVEQTEFAMASAERRLKAAPASAAALTSNSISGWTRVSTAAQRRID